jgi:hypothetical protein
MIPIVARILERADRALRRRSYRYFSWHRYRSFLQNVDQAREPLIVHQMGKVGSSTVVATLEQYAERYQVFQTHLFGNKYWRRAVALQRKASRDHRHLRLDDHLLASRYLAKQLARPKAGAPWTVITMVRDPVARNISEFFQSFDVYFSEEAAREGGDALNQMETERLRRSFLEGFGRFRHERARTWFQTHLEPFFGVDIYDTPFDKDRGYSILESKSCRLLVLRTEDLNRVLESALEEFLGVAVTKQVERNISSAKPYSAAYRAFKQGLRLPDAYIDRIYDSNYVRHFYTPDEIEAFKSRWRDQPASQAGPLMSG